MAKENIGPRIEAKTKDFYTELFSSVNAGASYILEAFPAIYRITLARELKGVFTRPELMLVIDVCNGLMLTPGIAGQHLPANVSDGIALDGLDKKWEIDGKALVAKLRGLSLAQLAIIEVWAQGFWESSNTGEGALKSPGAIEEWVAQLAQEKDEARTD